MHETLLHVHGRAPCAMHLCRNTHGLIPIESLRARSHICLALRPFRGAPESAENQVQITMTILHICMILLTRQCERSQIPQIPSLGPHQPPGSSRRSTTALPEMAPPYSDPRPTFTGRTQRLNTPQEATFQLLSFTGHQKVSRLNLVSLSEAKIKMPANRRRRVLPGNLRVGSPEDSRQLRKCWSQMEAKLCHLQFFCITQTTQKANFDLPRKGQVAI